MARVSGLLITGCWLFFLGYWIVNARGGKPVAERIKFFPALGYRLPLILGCLLLWDPNRLQPLDIVLTPRAAPAQFIGVAICALGLLVSIWARRTLAGNWSSAVTFKQDHELIKAGPYQFVRHPIYTGVLMMCLGTVVLEARLHCWLGLALFFIGFWVKLRHEELLMLQHFPNDYPDYRSRVKALVPFIL